MQLKVTFLLWVQAVLADALQLPTFIWDPRNKIFHGDVCAGQYAKISVNYEATIYFTCPHEALSNDVLAGDFTKKKSMYENMFLVSKEEFDNCEIEEKSKEKRQPVLKCDTPEDTSQIKFVSFYIFDVKSSLRYQFKVNTTYYFIATSNGEKSGLENLKGGRCKENNMKLAMHVRAQNDDSPRNDHMCFEPKKVSNIETESPTTTRDATNIYYTSESSTLSGEQMIQPPVAAASTNSNGKTANSNSINSNSINSNSINSNSMNNKNLKETIFLLSIGFFSGIIVMTVFYLAVKKWNERCSKRNDVKKMVSNPNQEIQNQLFIDNLAYRRSTEVEHPLIERSALSTEKNPNIHLNV